MIKIPTLLGQASVLGHFIGQEKHAHAIYEQWRMLWLEVPFPS